MPPEPGPAPGSGAQEPAQGEVTNRVAVELVVDRPGGVERRQLVLPAPASVGDALRASGLLGREPGLAQWPGIGVFGERCGPERLLRDGDRVEVYRALERDPKQRRRERAARRAGAAQPEPK